MATFTNGVAQTLAPGKYRYRAVFATGPMALSSNIEGQGFVALTDGAFTASKDGMLDVGKDEELSITLGAGDSFVMTVSTSGVN